MATKGAKTGADRTVVVTGASGRLGRLLRAAWDKTPPTGTQLLWSARQLDADLIWDVAAGTVDLPKGCVVLHLAAILRGAPEQMELNTTMARNVAAAARACGAVRVLMVSTAAVYGARDTACDETTTPQPFSSYGQAKLAAEEAMMLAAAPIPVTVLRIGNVVGADGLLGAAGASGVVLDPVQGQSGGPVRSWIGPQRLAAVLADLFGQGELPAILNVAADPPLPMADLLDAADVAWRYGPFNLAVLPRAVLDTGRVRAISNIPLTSAADLVADWRQLPKACT